MQRACRLVTFDAFHTLWKPKGGVSGSYVKEASKYQIQLNKQDVSARFGAIFREQNTRYPFYGRNDGLTCRQWWEQIVWKTMIASGATSEALSPHFANIFSNLYDRFATKDGYELYNDALPTLRKLKERGILMGIISNNDERLKSVVPSIGLSDYIDIIVLSYEIGANKPDRRIFEAALQKINETQGTPILPEQVLHVGDDEIKQVSQSWLRRDLGGAHDAGFHGVLLDRAKPSYEEVTLASDAVIDSKRHRIASLRELLPILGI